MPFELEETSPMRLLLTFFRTSLLQFTVQGRVRSRQHQQVKSGEHLSSRHITTQSTSTTVSESIIDAESGKQNHLVSNSEAEIKAWAGFFLTPAPNTGWSGIF